MDLKIRPIEKSDNERVAFIIRTVMPEFGCVGEGYSIEDPEVDILFETYNTERASFYVVTKNGGEVVGCGGIAPLAGGDGTICELQKMYFLKEARGSGVGRKMMNLLLKEAIRFGFKQCYLETVTRMDAANGLYQKTGFKKLPGALGNTGHSSCDTHYIKDLD